MRDPMYATAAHLRTLHPHEVQELLGPNARSLQARVTEMAHGWIGSLGPEYAHLTRRKCVLGVCCGFRDWPEHHNFFRGGDTDSWCKFCKRLKDSIKARQDPAYVARKTNARRSRTQQTVHEDYTPDQVWHKTNGICIRCGVVVDNDDWVIDHLLAVSEDGYDTLENVWVAHAMCNSRARATLG